MGVISSTLGMQRRVLGTGLSNSGGGRGYFYPYGLPIRLAMSSPQLISEKTSFPLGLGVLQTRYYPIDIGGIACALAGASSVSSLIKGTGNLVSFILGDSLLSPHMNAGVNRGASIVGASTLDGTIKGKGSLDITIRIGAAPSSLEIADAVWGRNTIPFTTPDTFGDKLNDLSSGGGASTSDIAQAVWDQPLTSNTTSGTFGVLVKKLLTIARFLRLK